jgi:hypothetical protein
LALEERIIDYYENSGEGFEHYARILNDKATSTGATTSRTTGTTARWAGRQDQEGMGRRGRHQPIDIVPRIATEVRASRPHGHSCRACGSTKSGALA